MIPIEGVKDDEEARYEDLTQEQQALVSQSLFSRVAVLNNCLQNRAAKDREGDVGKVGRVVVEAHVRRQSL